MQTNETPLSPQELAVASIALSLRKADFTLSEDTGTFTRDKFEIELKITDGSDTHVRGTESQRLSEHVRGRALRVVVSTLRSPRESSVIYVPIDELTGSEIYQSVMSQTAVLLKLHGDPLPALDTPWNEAIALLHAPPPKPSAGVSLLKPLCLQRGHRSDIGNQSGRQGRRYPRSSQP